MKYLITLTCLLLGMGPAAAAVDDDALPSDTAWYLHVDLDGMRDSKVGGQLYQWLSDEVFNDVRDETGFDFDAEVDELTAFGSEQGRATILIDGKLQQASRDKLMAAMAAAGDMQLDKLDGDTYYRVEGVDLKNKDINISSDTLYFAFRGDKRFVISTELDALGEALGGKANRSGRKDRALLVLTAERSLMQAGMDAAALDDAQRKRWNSGMLRQAKQLAFILADRNGNADLHLKVTADDRQVTDSLAAIVRGLIGLQALSEDTDRRVSELLGALKIDTDDSGMSLRLNVPAQTLTGLMSQ